MITITITYDFGFVFNAYQGSDLVKAWRVAEHYSTISSVVKIWIS